MPSFQPGLYDIFYNSFLTNLAIGYTNMNYIADQLFPVLEVDEPTGYVPKYTKSAWFRDEVQKRAPGTEAYRSGYGVDTSTVYRVENWAFGREIPDEFRRVAVNPFDMDRDAVRFVTEKHMLSREVAWATNFFATSKWTTDRTGVASGPSATQFLQWNDYGSSTPIVDVRTFRRTVRQLIQMRPNVLVLGDIVWDTLVDHPDIVERIKGGATTALPALVTREYVAQVLELERILVGTAMKASSAEGVAEASVSYADIWGKSGLLMYVAPAPGIMVPSAGYTLTWRNVTNPGAIQYIRRWRNDGAMVDIIEGQSWYAHTQTAADAGLFLATAVA